MKKKNTLIVKNRLFNLDYIRKNIWIQSIVLFYITINVIDWHKVAIFGLVTNQWLTWVQKTIRFPVLDGNASRIEYIGFFFFTRFYFKRSCGHGQSPVNWLKNIRVTSFNMFRVSWLLFLKLPIETSENNH